MSKILVIAEHLDGKLNASTARAVSAAAAVKAEAIDVIAVSYTHLTLPTKLL